MSIFSMSLTFRDHITAFTREFNPNKPFSSPDNLKLNSFNYAIDLVTKFNANYRIVDASYYSQHTDWAQAICTQIAIVEMVKLYVTTHVTT